MDMKRLRRTKTGRSPGEQSGAGQGTLPAFGIVAAVMGVVHALGSADRPAAELGALIACDGGDFPRHFIGLPDLFPISDCLRQKSAETNKMITVRQSRSAFLI